MNVKDLIANSHFAFLNQENQTALDLARQAIKLEPKNPNAHKCAANACMSLERYDEAIAYYRHAVQYDPNNGNRYYDLGYALATSEKLSDAMKNFAKAEELKCTPENTVQLYNILGIICFDIGRYDDALINLRKAEQLIGVDLEILQRIAVIYGIKSDIRNGLLTANQIKLVAPSDYRGYQIAFKLLIQDKRLESAQKELEKACKYATLTMDYYFDCITYETAMYQENKDSKHLTKSLEYVESSLKELKPTVVEVAESYINAAELYLQLENADKVIECLQAAQNPVESFNNGFDIINHDYSPEELTEYAVEEMIESDREMIYEKYGDYGVEELAEGIEPDEDGARDYLTEVDDEIESSDSDYKLSDNENVEYSSEHIDQINRLYVGAYTLNRDFNKVVEYAAKLQESENQYNSYIGRYTVANSLKELNSPDAVQKYEEAIKFFRSAMIKDPSDIAAVTFRIQCYIDIGNYSEAEQMCNLLTDEIKKPLLEKISEAKSGGDK